MVRQTEKMWESILKFGIGVVLIILANVIASKYILRFDLTEEKRFTVTNATKEMLSNLNDVVYVDVYLDGDLPAGLKRLRKAIKERLDEFKIYSGNNIQFQFIDPSLASSNTARNEFYNSLALKGLQPIRLFDNVDGQKTEKIIFPGAIISYGEVEKASILLKGARGNEDINQSIEGVEYELANAIRGLISTDRKKIGFIKGHAELDSLEMAGLTNVLLETYDVFNVNLPEKDAIEGYDAIIIAKPKAAFSEQDKYKIDQYLLKGGNVMLFIDQLYVDIDSALNQGTYALPIDINLDDQLFRYGVRVNRDLILDLNSGVVPVIVNIIDDKPDIQNFKWPFFPIINNFGDHPIVKNIDALYTKFISTIDTVKADNITKTPLLFSSQYSRKLGSPLKVHINDINNINQQDFADKKPLPIAYLLEGPFTSLYHNRFLPKGVDKSTFIETGKMAKLLVVSDGDFVRNELGFQTGQPLELGYSEFMRRKFANEDFVRNMLQYMTDDQGIILANTKEIIMRPLDKLKIREERLFWQIFNLGLPIFLLIVYGIIKHIIRKRKYTRFINAK